MNARRRSLDKWQDEDMPPGSAPCKKENARNSSNSSGSNHSSDPFPTTVGAGSNNLGQSDQSCFNHVTPISNSHEIGVGRQSSAYSNSSDPLTGPLCASPGGHLHFSSSHPLHHPVGLSQHQHLSAQTNSMLGAGGHGLMHSYQQHQLLNADSVSSHLLSQR